MMFSYHLRTMKQELYSPLDKTLKIGSATDSINKDSIADEYLNGLFCGKIILNENKTTTGLQPKDAISVIYAIFTTF